MPRLLLKNGRVIDPTSGHDGQSDILIENGRISAISANIEDSKAKVLDCTGLIVCPGFIDMHVHLREPGREDEETIESGAKAAAAGGVTAVAAMPNTNPVADNSSVIEFIVARAKIQKNALVFPIGAITVGQKGEQLAEMGGMAEAGAVGFSDDGNCVMDAEVMRRALEYSKMLDKAMIIHAEDANLSRKGHMNEGFYSTVLGIRGIPSEAESVIVGREIALARLTGARLHFAHISCLESVRLIASAKQEGLSLTCEVSPHHLLLTEDFLAEYNTNYKMNPPLRTDADRASLLEALNAGIIDVIASDHAPHAAHEKDREFCQAPFGVIGLETMVPMILSELVNTGELELTRFIEALTVKPAQILGLSELGYMSVGSQANLTVLDLNAKHIIHGDKSGNPLFQSKSTNSPFAGKEVKGAVAATIVCGEIVFQLNTARVE